MKNKIQIYITTSLLLLVVISCSITNTNKQNNNTSKNVFNACLLIKNVKKGDILKREMIIIGPPVLLAKSRSESKTNTDLILENTIEQYLGKKFKEDYPGKDTIILLEKDMLVDSVNGASTNKGH